MTEVLLLDENTMNRSLVRISHEILEQNKGTEELVLIGIKSRGIYLAERIANRIEQIEGQKVPIGSLDITLYRDDLHRNDLELQPTVNDLQIPFDVNGKHIVLVDDVLFTGRTVRAALDAIIDHGRPKKISLAILIDRGHRELPIRPDYIGKNIPTATHEQVRVRVKELDGIDSVSLQK